jgi:hypothetical protein
MKLTFDNIIVRHSAWRKSDIPTLFGNEEVHFTDANELSVLMKELGVFKSTSEARRAGRTGPIPDGFTFEFKASKKRRLWIWNPTE